MIIIDKILLFTICEFVFCILDYYYSLDYMPMTDDTVALPSLTLYARSKKKNASQIQTSPEICLSIRYMISRLKLMFSQNKMSFKIIFIAALHLSKCNHIQSKVVHGSFLLAMLCALPPFI